jgi:hypothetical protein
MSEAFFCARFALGMEWQISYRVLSALAFEREAYLEGDIYTGIVNSDLVQFGIKVTVNFKKFPPPTLPFKGGE